MIEKLGHYTILSELGRGGMGVVLKGHDPDLNRDVAIKVLSQQIVHDETLIERFKREARSAARLNHPNIVQIYQIGQHEGQYFFVMEFVEGESLGDLLRREKRLSIRQAAEILFQTASALAAAHDHEIIHRDIKPGNIMLNRAGIAKVADFGIAFMPDTEKRLTSTGHIMGTPGYLSPEVCTGEMTDHRSDIFSLGIVYFEMLSGRLPFRSDSPYGLIHQVVQNDVPDVRQINQEVDDATYSILSRMVEKDRDRRYADCHAILRDLENGPLDGKVPSLSGNTAISALILPPVPKPPPANVTAAANNQGAATVPNTPTNGIEPEAPTPVSAEVPPPLPVTEAMDSDQTELITSGSELPQTEVGGEPLAATQVAAAVPPPPLAATVPGVSPPGAMAHHQVSPPSRTKKRSLLLPILAIAAILFAMAGVTAFMMKDRIAGFFTKDDQDDVEITGPPTPFPTPIGEPSSGDPGIGPNPAENDDVPKGLEDERPERNVSNHQERSEPDGKPGGSENERSMAVGPGLTQPLQPHTENPPNPQPTPDPRPERDYQRNDPNIALLIAGDPTLAEPIASVLETNLGLDKFRVVSRQDLLALGTDEDPAPIGETLYREGVDVMVHVRLIPTGERSVRAGRRSADVFASRVNLRVIQLRDRKMLNRRWSKPVEYTSLNAEGRAEGLAREIGNVVYDLFKQ